MGGEIWLDKDYDSGVPGCPGARFVVNLKFPPIDTSKEDLEKYQVDGESGGTGTTILSDGDTDLSLVPELPTELSVLFVDDDPILRKLFARTVKTVAPTWTFREASNGETALRLVETEHFDLIFVDM